MPTDSWSKKMFTNNSTGTVPKMMYRNNRVSNRTNHEVNQPELQNHLSNNLDLSWQRQNSSNFSRNLERTVYDLNPYSMDVSVMEDRRQNDLVHMNMPGRTNETLSTSSSSISNSRRDSSGTMPKCDNVKKYPDKKQIEDQLNQIREYLRVTTSLMTSIKNNDDQLLENGIDNLSEYNASAYQRNGLEEKVEFTNRKVQLLREQQNALINLKRKAENQLCEVRHLADENQLLNQHPLDGTNQLRNTKNDQARICSDAAMQASVKNYNENCFDPAIKELEDRISEMKKDSLRHLAVVGQENGFDQSYLHDRLESSNQLLHMLENRDGQLTSEHVELQQKLNELQKKKTQIDQLAEQLHNLGDAEDEDIGNHVRKIVTMKQHLSSLKDLLEVVKSTEFSLLNTQNINDLESVLQDNHVCTKTDNIRQNVRMNHNQNAGCNSVRANEQWLNEKDSNKALIGIQEREKVLTELKAKKRELEEIMYKQKDRASINNDVCSEISVNKSESSTNNNMFDGSVMSWLPVHPHHHNQNASAYSSDDCPEEDANEYSDLNSTISVNLENVNHQSPGLGINSTVNISKPRTDINTRGSGCLPNEFVRGSLSLTPERRAAGMSTATSALEQERFTNANNRPEQNKVQVQKQLELIQQVCQSLLDQQSSNGVQQLRNNLSPSPLYSDSRNNVPTNQQVSAMNYVNPSVEMPYVNLQQMNPPQMFAINDVTNNQNMLAANSLQTQAFLLSTLNQCCQMLWFQQREITSLRNMICSIQDQILNRHVDQEISEIPSINPYIFPTQPTVYHAPSQLHNATPKVNQVSSACSMPNLNPSSPHANIEGAFTSHNNIRSSPSARLLDSSLNNISNQNLLGEHSANNTVLASVNVANMNHSLPAQIWNGQALNNQVAPGNRANNYWDNFRSYSRQNLLSTSSKSNEILQNPTTSERSNTIYDRSQSFSLPSNVSPKLNTVHNESIINVSEESTPRRHLHFKTSHTNACNKSGPAIPPDVLNINHNVPHQKSSETAELSNEMTLDVSGASGESQTFKEQMSDRARNRNEWHDGEQPNNTPKSKLFEELRDNVYKEVANLISANENRPHFLIQLFRDLQHINSDSMRGRTLQSIQTVLTHSLVPSETKRSANRQSSGISIHGNTDQEAIQIEAENFSTQPSSWALPLGATSVSRESTHADSENEDPNVNNVLKPIATFLHSHKGEIFHQELMEVFRGLLIKSIPFVEIFTSRNIQEQTFLKHIGIIFNESLEKYKGRRISEIYKDVLKTVTDILVGELSFIYLIQEHIPENNCEQQPFVSENMKLHLQHHSNQVEEGHTPQMQNGDLAEADQSRLELQQEEEEGAVGGVLNGVVDVLSNNTNTADQIGPDITDLPKIDFPTEPEVEFMEQGLDQVPTRLTTKSRSHSNTPSRDRSSSRNDTMDHF